MKNVRWRWVGWSVPVGILLLPAVAMRFTEEVNWDTLDFLVAAILLGTTGIGIELAIRFVPHPVLRGAAVLACAAALVTTWAILATGG